MNYRILEIRQLTGPRGLSAAHLTRIKKIKRGSIFEDKMADEKGNYKTAFHVDTNIVTDQHDDDEVKKSEEVTDATPKTRKTNGKYQSPSKLLSKPKNDDSSESSSIKDSGYEELENNGMKTKNKGKIKRTNDKVSAVKSRRGKSQTTSREDEISSKLHDLPEPRKESPIFSLKEINSIWATNEEDEDDEERDKSSVESMKHDSDGEYIENNLSPLSSRTTILY